MYVAVFIAKDKNKETFWGSSYDMKYTKKVTKYLSKMKHPEDFFIVYSDGKIVKEVSLLNFIANDYSFDGIGKIVKEL